MNLLLRLLIVLASARFRGRLKVDDVSRVRLRVLPNDLDLNLHMNNGRYLTLMDLGRIDLILRTGLLSAFLKNRWSPVIGGALIRYRFSLFAFQKFDIVTEVIGWDDKWFYFKQKLKTENGTAAISLSKGLVTDRSGTILPIQVLSEIGVSQPSPVHPEALAHWLSAEQLLHEEGEASDEKQPNRTTRRG